LPSPHYTPGFGAYDFAIRRLHSLLGLVPLGAYLVFHLATNASVIDGIQTYQERANQIHVLGNTTVQIIGWAFILGPLLFHGVIGLLIVLHGRRNVLRYPYLENMRYTLVRLTGVVVFVFVIWHVFHMTGWIPINWWNEHVAQPWGGAQFDPTNVVTAVEAVRATPWTTTAYIVGTLAAVYHLSAGLWTAGITWGVWTSRRSQMWARVPCLVFGLGLGAIGMGILVGMYNVDLAGDQQASLGAGLVLLALLLPTATCTESRSRGGTRSARPTLQPKSPNP
jgi:succinate dehydrogenase / fumarate reductase, cytochrome b subunit